MFEAVGIGDLHLTSPGNNLTLKGGLSAYISNHDEMVKDLVLSQPLEYAKSHGIRTIFLYGDIFESTRGSYEGTLALLEILRQDFDFHIILGNHDLFAEDPEQDHSLQIVQTLNFKNVHIYTRPTNKKIDGANIRFLPWPHLDFDKRALNVFHNDVVGAKTDSGKLVEVGKPLKEHAVGGHIHTNQRIRNTHYSGTLYQTNFGESQKKFFHHISHDGAWEIQDIKCKYPYTLHNIKARSKQDFEHVPRDPSHLVSLTLLPENTVKPEHYEGLRVVRIKAANTYKWEDLPLPTKSEVLEFNLDEFVEHWVAAKAGRAGVKKALAVLERIRKYAK